MKNFHKLLFNIFLFINFVIYFYIIVIIFIKVIIMFLLRIIMINFKVFNKEFSQDFFLNKKVEQLKVKIKLRKKQKRILYKLLVPIRLLN